MLHYISKLTATVSVCMDGNVHLCIDIPASEALKYKNMVPRKIPEPKPGTQRKNSFVSFHWKLCHL